MENIVRLRNVRKALGLNQTDMGAKMGLGITAYSMVERGDRTLQLKHLERLYESTPEVNRGYIEEGKGQPLKGYKEEEFLRLIGEMTEEQQVIILEIMKQITNKNKKV